MTRRLALRRLAEVAGGRGPDLARVQDLDRPGDTPGLRIPLRRYDPGAGTAGLVVYAHGGGWVAGDLETHDVVCRLLAEASGCVVLAVDYRRPPEHPAPAAVDDVLAVARWVGQTGPLILAGDSAGANIVAAACLQARGDRALAIRLQVLICPILEIAPSQPSRTAFAQGFFIDPAQFAADAADYAGASAALDDPRLSPLRAPDLSGSPPTLIHVAEFDPFRDEGLAYAQRLRQSGAQAWDRTHPGMIHYFYALPRAIPYARQALQAIGREMRSALEIRT